MKSAVFAVFKKELKRFFSDRRMVITTLLLPGLLIFVMYNFMGNAVTNMIDGGEEKYVINAVNIPKSIKMITEQEQIGFEINETDISELQAVKDSLKDGEECDACVVFPEDFDTAVSRYDSHSGEKAPEIKIYYNSSSAQSAAAYQTLISMLDMYESSMINKFDINTGNEVYDLVDNKDMTGQVFSMLLPMLLMMFLYSSCVSVVVEAIAGEKERGTIATMLVTPAKRSHIAIGKIASLSLIALLSASISTVCTIASLPALMGAESEMISGGVYGIKDYLLTALIILSTVLVMISLILIASAFASSVKEAQTYIIPIMIIVLAAGISGMFGNPPDRSALYLIPLYNSVQCMSGIFSFNINYANIVITVISNTVYTGLGIVILTRLFNSERVMFSK